MDKNTAMTTIILVNARCGIGFHMTVSDAAISGIPDDVVEAAKLDGAVGIKKVFHIIIPMIWESIISSIVVIVTAVLKTFDLVYVMTEGGPNGLTDVPSTLLYKEAFRYNDFGKASVIGAVSYTHLDVYKRQEAFFPRQEFGRLVCNRQHPLSGTV